MRLIDITGQRFGRMLVLGKASEPAVNGGSLWRCICDCGQEKTVNSGCLRRGNTKSCGCLAAEWSRWMGSNREFIAKRIPKTTRHGHKRTGLASPEYRTWLGMKRRCYDPKCKDFPNWGGRGIKVCERWNASFEAFLDDMGPKPVGYTIDRLNPNLDYGPSNCRWAPQAAQGAENRRGLRPVTIQGVTYLSLKAASRAFGVSHTTINERLRRGLSMEEAVSTPTGKLPNRRPRESYLPRNKRA